MCASGPDDMMNKRLCRVLRCLVLPHQSEVVVQSGLQRVKANVSSPNSFSTMAENQYTGLILQTRTRPYLQITFRTRPDPLKIDINAQPTPEKFDTLHGTPGNHTTWCWNGALD